MPVEASYKGYASTLWNLHSSLATWQPDRQLVVGDVVACGAGGVTKPETSLSKLGVPAGRLTVAISDAAAVREHHGVAVSAGAGGTVAATASAKARFSSDASFLIVTEKGTLQSVSNMADTRALLEELHANGTWQKGWHLVTSVRTYPACTIIIAREKGVEVGVIVAGSAAGLTPDAVQAGAQVSVNSSQVSHWVMTTHSTPMFEAIGMRRKWRGPQAADTSHRYLTRDEGTLANDEMPDGLSLDDGGAGEEPNEYIAQMSSPTDLGLT